MTHLILHVGAHGTDGGRIAGWLARNRTRLEAQGLVVPAPGQFLRQISSALDLGRNDDPVEREAALIAALGATGKRLVVSAPGLLGGSADVLASDGFYRRDVARRLFGLQALFGQSRVSVLLAVASAGQVIPALLPDEPGAAETLMAAVEDQTLPWARLAQSIRVQLPRAGLLVWRHEDLPRLWPEVLRALVGPGVVLPPAGLLDIAAAHLGAEARLRLQRYLTANPPASARQLRDVIEAFARRFGQSAAADAHQALPGWLRSRLAGLDQGYATEWGDLAGLKGVQTLHDRRNDADDSGPIGA